MNANVLLLFDIGKYERRKTVAQLDFEKDYFLVLQEFARVVPQAFSEMKAIVNQIPVSERGRGLNAYILNGMLCGRMMLAFPDICKPKEYGRVTCSIGDTDAYFKKLDENHMPSNVLTDHVQAIQLQMCKRNENGCGVVNIGYVTNEMWTEVTGLYAVYINGNKIVWETDINSLMGGNTITIPLNKPIQPLVPNEPSLKRTGRKQNEM